MAWIAITDSLPPVGEPVIVWNVPANESEYCQIGMLDYDFVWISEDQYRLEDVKYWIEIPYKQVETE